MKVVKEPYQPWNSKWLATIFEVVCKQQLPHASKIMHFLKLYLRLYEPCNHSKNASSSCLWCQLFVVAAPGGRKCTCPCSTTWHSGPAGPLQRSWWNLCELWWFTVEHLALIFENGRMEPDVTFIISYKCNTGLKNFGFARIPVIPVRTVRITSCPIWSDRCIPVTQKNPH